MRVICPYAGELPPTVVLAQLPDDIELVQLPLTLADTSGYAEDAPESAYWRLIRDLWASGEDFAIVEHDVEIHNDVIPTLTTCPSGWCVYPYPGEEAIWTSRQRQGDTPRATRTFRCALGCTRFRADFTAKHPLALEHMRHKHWRRIDSQLASFLFQHGEKACEHEPHVKHHHDYQNDPILNRWRGQRRNA